MNHLVKLGITVTVFVTGVIILASVLFTKPDKFDKLEELHKKGDANALIYEIDKIVRESSNPIQCLVTVATIETTTLFAVTEDDLRKIVSQGVKEMRKNCQ